MRFGIFDHLDDSGLPLTRHFEERLKLIEAYDRAGFYGYHLGRASQHAARLRALAGHCSCRRWRSAPSSCNSGRWSICCRSTIRCG